jgi:hypothetical protein
MQWGALLWCTNGRLNFIMGISGGKGLHPQNIAESMPSGLWRMLLLAGMDFAAVY